MYLPDMFAVTDAHEVDAVLQNARLGCLVTRDAAGFFGTHLPMIFDAERRSLMGHISRANQHPDRSGDDEALVIFQGLDAYVSPSWYPSKQEHGKVVPTWNYEVAHVTGKLNWRDDPEWLREQLAKLTARFESGRPEPWAMSDAPEDYLARQIAGVIGVELDVREVRVKRKLSQNRVPRDREGVIAGLHNSSVSADQMLAVVMAERSAGQGNGG